MKSKKSSRICIVILYYICTKVFIILGCRDFIYFLIYVGVSLLGLTTLPLFYALLLLDLVARIPALKNVLLSVVINYK